MTPSYLGRLLLLACASFFVAQVVMEALVAWFTPLAIRRAQDMRPKRAARFLLALRLLPVTCSLIVITTLCIPSYLRFEPVVAEEEAGLLCLAAALLGLVLCSISITRAAAALIRSARYVRENAAQESTLDGKPVWIVRNSAGLALAGILSPRLLISERAMNELSTDQLAVALRHEQAHRASRDNLKRLLMLLAPGILPQLRLLEQAWTRYAEWAADDQAAQGDSIALAEALVRVARLQSNHPLPPLVMSLVDPGEDLSQRVDRLLNASVMEESKVRFAAPAVSMAALLILWAAINPNFLQAVHRLLELLLD